MKKFDEFIKENDTSSKPTNSQWDIYKTVRDDLKESFNENDMFLLEVNESKEKEKTYDVSFNVKYEIERTDENEYDIDFHRDNARRLITLLHYFEEYMRKFKKTKKDFIIYDQANYPGKGFGFELSYSEILKYFKDKLHNSTISELSIEKYDL